MGNSMDASIFSQIVYQRKNKIVDDWNFLENFKLPEFNTLEFSTKELIEVYANKLIQNVQTNVNSKNSILYYINITVGEVDKIKAEVAKYKSLYTNAKDSNQRSLPQINNDNDSNCLYVGKPNKDFINRFKQHLDLPLCSKSTYALHLAAWSKELNLELTLNYCIINLPEERKHLLEEIETLLHNELKPILGRKGH